MQQVDLVGVVVDLLGLEDALDRVTQRALATQEHGSEVRPLSVVSANLDHIAQFGRLGRWYDTLDYSLGMPNVSCAVQHGSNSDDWLVLLDGAPLVAEATRLTGKTWPRLAGSDIIGPLLDRAETEGLSVGFLGGSYVVQRVLSRSVTRTRPSLKVSGYWAPDRKELIDHEASLRLADSIRSARTQILVVGLGKPRQELWMAKYGPTTGANVLLAFGAVVDFLAGSIQRAPSWASENGLEWAWRLALEPRRLARRYLVDDPPSLLRLRRESRLITSNSLNPPSENEFVAAALDGSTSETLSELDRSPLARCFSPHGQQVDVTVLAVTFNNADTIEELIATLRAETEALSLRVVVADNGSSDSTLELLAQHPDVITVRTGGNLGYAGGLNTVMHLARGCEAVLVLNPDLMVQPQAISLLLDRMRRSGAGIVVPQLLESDGSTYISLRREPSIFTAIGDALCGARFTGRPSWASELDYDAESYQHPHRIDWATGAALLINGSLAQRLGAWDEQFFLYSEEVDYFRRAREGGESIWYEPAARMTHHMGGSGASTALSALMAVNRIRYVRKYHTKNYASAFRSAVLLAEGLRAFKPNRRGIFKTILDESSWGELPRPSVVPQNQDALADFPSGTIIIPAHNEESVIARTLHHLAVLAASGSVQVIVACNGCTDRTASIASSFPGVKVIEVEEASKVAALNAADEVATRWPRVYLDADIEMSPTAVKMVLDRLTHSGALAARPAFEYDDSRASALVRAFYRARRRIPSTSQALWGAGVYGLSKEGHAKFGAFPTLTADDLFVDQQFETWEKVVLNTPPVRVVTPRTVASLSAILQRNYRGQTEFTENAKKLPQSVPVPTAFLGSGDIGSRRTTRELLGSVRGPGSAFDAAIYAFFVASARLKQKRLSAKIAIPVWERDVSSRS
ncbi:WecB/TagA/CpsF family glycosyltransferase [Arthrobacter sp. MYb227]|uniref:WecB/TagA/CpsF family glycosyltransferase n=1 Tax=Arthrobacter sp. MYb227 TaxID=1848601 RepID=UPI0015E27AE0|nr:WecB/TagA/CpsF family glycosyltransferase [Arthrobacter sp. MYb227]